MRTLLIAPSILSADFSKLGKEVRDVEAAGADWIHVDVMDGHFVPNLTIGPAVIKSIRPASALPFDVHLMIDTPENFVGSYIDAGSDIITFHVEACKAPQKLIERIRAANRKVGLSLRPKTPVDSIMPYLKEVDLVLVMMVEPGFGGQVFMEEVVPKISQIRKLYGGDIEVDGGINTENARKVIDQGANILVAGTSVFRQKDYREAIRRLKTNA